MKSTQSVSMSSIGSIAVLVGALMYQPAEAALRTTVVDFRGTQTGLLQDDASGIEWLAPRATNGLSFASVAANGYLTSGFRYATASELTILLAHAGYDTSSWAGNPYPPFVSRSPTDIASVKYLIGLLGSTTKSQPIIYGILGDVFSGAAQPSQGNFMATLMATQETYSYVNIPGATFPTSDGDTGSFLVREISAVPEAGTLAMLMAGLATLGLARLRKTRQRLC